MSNPWNAPVSSCGRRGGLGGVTVREADLSAQRRLVYRLLSDGKPRSSADIAAELHLCDPRAIIRDLRNAGFPAVVYSKLDEMMHQPNEYCSIKNTIGDAKVFLLAALNLK